MKPVNGYVIVTDTTCDLPLGYIDEKQLDTLPISVNIEGKEISGRELLEMDFKKFYDDMRTGALPQTTALSPFDAKTLFEAYMSKGIRVIYVGLSSGLSASYDNAVGVMNELNEKYPESKSVVIDSLSASLGIGLLIYLAIEKMEQGYTFEQMVEWFETTIKKLCAYFTVDDLFHLHRGGRLSKTSAIMGSVLGVKPVLKVDDNGKLVPISKVRGRKKALDALLQYMEQKIQGVENTTVAIGHGDCLEDAEYLESEIKKRFKINNCIINDIGAVIGGHTGPGIIALVFLGNSR